jgi:hypothetical protein
VLTWQKQAGAHVQSPLPGSSPATPPRNELPASQTTDISRPGVVYWCPISLPSKVNGSSESDRYLRDTRQSNPRLIGADSHAGVICGIGHRGHPRVCHLLTTRLRGSKVTVGLTETEGAAYLGNNALLAAPSLVPVREGVCRWSRDGS